MRISRAQLLVSPAACAALVAAAVTPQLLARPVAHAFHELSAASPVWLAAAAACFLAAFCCTVAAWRAALTEAGGRIAPHQAAARLGVGSLVNALAPAKLGDTRSRSRRSSARPAPR